MNTEQWSNLKAWFSQTGRNSKAIPAEVKDALEILIDERDSEDDDGGEEEDDEEEE